MAMPDTQGVLQVIVRLRALLARARELKLAHTIEPPLPSSEFQGDLGLPFGTTRFVAVELAARQLFEELVGTTAIEDSNFVHIWNLLDILSICGDQGQCEPSLVWWLIEELLETQRIDGCRTILDYLESRRERLIAKNFIRQKDIVILRAFNELLRRLSRAEEAVLCGRVFIFLFQSFPLGARSSVNPKGEFHTDNVTTFEKQDRVLDDSDMSIDATPSVGKLAVQPEQTPIIIEPDSSLSEDALYPIFWTMQQVFSNPPTLFREEVFEEFKKGLNATLTKFNEVATVSQGTTESHKSTKRKAEDSENDDEFGNTFNPKYLTSRDLFSLELSDLAFQRHTLVQALILIDFLLSLTDKAKKRLAHITVQKALQYEYTLSEKNAEWAEKTKKAISKYISDGPDGTFYYRMVSTVLSRDKNWVRWKLENCPIITRVPLSSERFNDGTKSAKVACTSRPIRATPGTLDLKFLSAVGNAHSRDTSNISARIPDMQALVTKVSATELDLEMADGEEAELLHDAKASKIWRALRQGSRTKLSLFEKAEDGKDLQVFVETLG
ncbi:hypothetical protein EJ08DRAFT_700482 [Tothia fuscella]|uniref:Nuclear matrix protein n=1 Tax=Tothia fuscella TaxID=1048955 RepID=A0A9P4NK11_9PEZI|nr:hypothetical protein EJ08DRAFT_700482 [Tothia fuscella]